MGLKNRHIEEIIVKTKRSDKILVSVLMPVYQANMRQLKIAVESILRQTYRYFELLILYEGDKIDPCYEMLSNMKDHRLVMILIPPKSGLPGSLNIGIRQAKGKYIARMDADDYSLPYRFEQQIAFMESHPDTDAVGGICRYMNSRTISFSTMIPPERRAARMLFSHAGIAHPTAMIRKEFLEKNDIWYNELIKGSEDYHLWIDFVLAGGRIDSIDRIVLLYRIHGGQASKVLKKEMTAWDNMGRERLLDAIGVFSDEEKEIIYQFCDVNNHRIEIGLTLKALHKLGDNGSRCGLFEADVFQKEICYEWIHKAMSSLKKGNGRDMLKRRVMKTLWTKGVLVYLISEYYRKIKGKAITNFNFNRRKYKC